MTIASAMLQLQRCAQNPRSAIDLADAITIGQAHIAIEGRVGAFLLHGMDREDFDARGLAGHQEHGDSGMFGRVRIGAGDQEDIVGEFCAGGEHLLAIDDPFLTGLVPDRAGLGSEDVRA